ncbi:glycoside hydrolase family protein [Paenibacillus cymbidii]|uniref:hypothetical protein n=1 Tax=Paenibacillus cymbidii TaxID=1639034 RepID=UPI00107FF1D6|nr:hypothetical protein [Paenibacillus cymbidii]
MEAFVNAASFGFAPEATGLDNARALQNALDQGGTIVVSRPGVYKLARTVYIGSYTTLVFGNGITVQKQDEEGPFCHVILNKGALTKTYDTRIAIENLHIVVNGMDIRKFEVFGLHGQLAFFYVRDLRIERFRCLDLGKMQYAIHICTFEDVIVRDAIIKGDKDGVHLGRGRRFHISECVFETYDDAVALNAHDYDVGNPELGWIEDGVVENCRDLARDEANEGAVGFFCRILAGGWSDWRPGMEVQKSDTVVSAGRLYRVKADPDATVYVSHTQPVHEHGIEVLDGISWAMVQDDVTYTAGVRNVTFRNISLGKARIGFSIHFDNDKYSRSYYPGSPVPSQEQLMFDHIRVLHDHKKPLLRINTPVDALLVTRASLKDSNILFEGNRAMDDYLPTAVSLLGCVFRHPGEWDVVENRVPNKAITLQTAASVVMDASFVARVQPGPGTIRAASDLPGLQPVMGAE